MSDYTLTNIDQGIYEIPLAANTLMSVNLESPAFLVLMVHSGTSPVYVEAAPVTAIKSRRATIALPGQWVDVPGSSTFLSAISASDSVVSVYRL